MCGPEARETDGMQLYLLHWRAQVERNLTLYIMYKNTQKEKDAMANQIALVSIAMTLFFLGTLLYITN